MKQAGFKRGMTGVRPATDDESEEITEEDGVTGVYIGRGA